MKIIQNINSPNLWLRNFPWKKKKHHKYSRGKLIVLGGQINMTGATILSAEAALRIGVGSVKILCSKKTLPIYSSKFPCFFGKYYLSRSQSRYYNTDYL